MATAITFLACVIGYCIDPIAFEEFTNTLLATKGKYIVHFVVIYDVISLINSKEKM